MLQLYHSHVFSQLIYALPIWGSHQTNATYLQPLHRTHKKIIRLICNRPPQTPTKPLYQQLQILNIFNLYIHRTAIDMHPFIHPPSEQLNRPQHNHQYIRAADIHQHATRFASTQSLYVPNTNQYLATYKPSHTINHYAAKFSHIWNKIPHNIRSITDKTEFKTALKQHLQTEQDEQPARPKPQHHHRHRHHLHHHHHHQQPPKMTNQLWLTLRAGGIDQFLKDYPNFTREQLKKKPTVRGAELTTPNFNRVGNI